MNAGHQGSKSRTLNSIPAKRWLPRQRMRTSVEIGARHDERHVGVRLGPIGNGHRALHPDLAPVTKQAGQNVIELADAGGVRTADRTHGDDLSLDQFHAIVGSGFRP